MSPTPVADQADLVISGISLDLAGVGRVPQEPRDGSACSGTLTRITRTKSGVAATSMKPSFSAPGGIVTSIDGRDGSPISSGGPSI